MYVYIYVYICIYMYIYIIYIVSSFHLFASSPVALVLLPALLLFMFFFIFDARVDALDKRLRVHRRGCACPRLRCAFPLASGAHSPSPSLRIIVNSIVIITSILFIYFSTHESVFWINASGFIVVAALALAAGAHFLSPPRRSIANSSVNDIVIITSLLFIYFSMHESMFWTNASSRLRSP